MIGVLPWRALGRAISRRIAPAYSTGTDTFAGPFVFSSSEVALPAVK